MQVMPRLRMARYKLSARSDNAFCNGSTAALYGAIAGAKRMTVRAVLRRMRRKARQEALCPCRATARRRKAHTFRL